MDRDVTDRKPTDAFSLRRWSQRKLAASREARDASPSVAAAHAGSDPRQPAPVAQPVLPVGGTGSEARSRTPSDSGRDVAASEAPTDAIASAPVVASPASTLPRSPVPSSPEDVAATLPPVETLTFDSDFKAFMQPGVGEDLRRSALRKLLRDPRFNVMDGLDVYIDDYSKPDPIDPEIVRTLVQARYLFAPPKTRVNDEGCVEDVVEDETSAVEASSNDATAAATIEDAKCDADRDVRPAAKDENDDERA